MLICCSLKPIFPLSRNRCNKPDFNDNEKEENEKEEKEENKEEKEEKVNCQDKNSRCNRYKMYCTKDGQ